MTLDVCPNAPSPEDHWALFLDIDGTLLEIAPTPDSVIVPASLIPTLRAASQRLGGALAIVSGRPLGDIDRLLGAANLPCAAEHGAITRLADGRLVEADPAYAVPENWKAAIADATRDWSGVIVELKKYSLAAHFRLAPQRESDLRALFEGVVSPHGGGFEILPAHCGLEIRHQALHKGSAVRLLMNRAPFAGRLPVFVGDDVTDEDGFRAAAAMGGFGLHVAESFGGRPAKVRDWLETFTSRE